MNEETVVGQWEEYAMVLRHTPRLKTLVHLVERLHDPPAWTEIVVRGDGRQVVEQLDNGKDDWALDRHPSGDADG